MDATAEEDILGGPAGRPGAAGDADTLGGGSPDAPAAPAPSLPVADTEEERLADATRSGPLLECPPAYADGTDWQTIHADDPFRVLYLDYRQHGAITDEQVQAAGRVLGAFWESRRKLLIRGGDRLKARFGEGTIEQAPARLEKAVRALADAGRRQAYARQLEEKRQAAAAAALDVDLARVLDITADVMNPRAIKNVLAVGVAAGFTLPEAEAYLQRAMRKARLEPVKNAPPVAHPLLATWTIDGAKPVGQAHIKVLRQEVYDLDQAGQVLYRALAAGDDRATEALDDLAYLENIADTFKENDVQLALRTIFRDKQYNLPNLRNLRRLKALYLLGPSLPLYLPGVAEFTSPGQLLSRTATVAADFAAAEAAFAAGTLPIWVQAAATADVQAALPDASAAKALDFRRFLHRAAPAFPLWIGQETFASPAQLAAYIQRDENAWKMVYGSFAVGNVGLWLQATGHGNVLARQAQAASLLLAGLEPASEAGRRLTMQALLEALDPRAAKPTLQVSPAHLDLTGLSGETKAERTLTLTNATGGPVRVLLTLKPALDGVSLSTQQLFFDQWAPGQQLSVTVTGDPARMPRDGRHAGSLHASAVGYQASEVPVTAEAVFPQKEFWQFVLGAGLVLAAVFGGVRWLLGLALGPERYEQAVARGSSLPLKAVLQLDGADSLPLVGLLVLWLVLVYIFGRALLKRAKPRSSP